MKINKLTFFFSVVAIFYCGMVFAAVVKPSNQTSAVEPSTQSPIVPPSNQSTVNEIPVRVTLDNIEVVKISEPGGDELYFDITQYSNQGRAKTARVPQSPIHWLSKQLAEVKNALLWEGVVHDKEEMKIIISLVEQDTPPWDVDDMIGSALLILENKGGKLTPRWELPVFEDKVEQEMLESGNPQRFIMRGDHSHYTLAFKVESAVGKAQFKDEQTLSKDRQTQSTDKQTHFKDKQTQSEDDQAKSKNKHAQAKALQPQSKDKQK